MTKYNCYMEPDKDENQPHEITFIGEFESFSRLTLKHKLENKLSIGKKLVIIEKDDSSTD